MNNKALLCLVTGALFSASVCAENHNPEKYRSLYHCQQHMNLEFIGEDTLPTGYVFEGIELGGLSGIDYNKRHQNYIAICDDRAENGPARFYTLNIDLSDGYLNAGDVSVQKMTEILDADGSAFAPGSVDPESIRLREFPGLLYWSSEGNASTGIAPFVRVMTMDGVHLDEFELPKKFLPTADSGVRNNLAFESLTSGPSGNRFYTATENALAQDGPAASVTDGSYARVLELNARNGKAKREFIYPVDPVAAAPIPGGAFSTNGLVELLNIDKNTFIAVERSFSVGVGNSIKLYLTSTRGASNVRRYQSIEDRRIRKMQKRLLLDLADLGITLDNIEGITFGPKLPSGERTLILVSDNNFNPNGQFTQFLAFKILDRY